MDTISLSNAPNLSEDTIIMSLNSDCKDIYDCLNSIRFLDESKLSEYQGVLPLLQKKELIEVMSIENYLVKKERVGNIGAYEKEVRRLSGELGSLDENIRSVNSDIDSLESNIEELSDKLNSRWHRLFTGKRGVQGERSQLNINKKYLSENNTMLEKLRAKYKELSSYNKMANQALEFANRDLEETKDYINAGNSYVKINNSGLKIMDYMASVSLTLSGLSYESFEQDLKLKRAEELRLKEERARQAHEAQMRQEERLNFEAEREAHRARRRASEAEEERARRRRSGSGDSLVPVLGGALLGDILDDGDLNLSGGALAGAAGGLLFGMMDDDDW